MENQFFGEKFFGKYIFWTKILWKIIKNNFLSGKSRYEETNELATTCKPGEKCIGGFARMVTMIKHLKETLKDTNPIFLNAGDNFQGTLWYSIGRWKLTTQFMNMLDADAVVSRNYLLISSKI